MKNKTTEETTSKVDDILRKLKNVNTLNKFNSFIFSLFFIAFLSFLVILLLFKFGINGFNLPNNQIGINILKGSDGNSLIKSIPIYIGILSFFFTVFIFIFQSYIKILLDSISNIPEIIKMNTTFEIAKEFKKKDEDYDEKQKELIRSMTELIKKPQELSDLIEKNKKYYESNSRLVFQIANQFLEKNKQVPVSSMNDLLDLWDENRAEFAAFSLRAQHINEALPFLKERFEHYKKHKLTQITRAIKDAIEDLEKKRKKS